MREETKRQIGEFYAAVARLTGLSAAGFAIWSGVSVIRRFLNQESFVVELLTFVILGFMAALLLSAKSEYPSISNDHE